MPEYIKAKFASWRKTREQNFPHHPFHEEADDFLIDHAVAVLAKAYHGVDPEFQQGHFSHPDVVIAGNDLVMFSNLYWAWRASFYDAALTSHWYTYELAHVPGMTIAQIEEQRWMWERSYKKLTSQLPPEEKRLFALARIERLAAGLNLDALSITQDHQNDLAKYLADQTRQDLTGALQELDATE